MGDTTRRAPSRAGAAYGSEHFMTITTTAVQRPVSLKSLGLALLLAFALPEGLVAHQQGRTLRASGPFRPGPMSNSTS